VKPCPQDALEIKLSYQIGFFNASLRPKILSDEKIGWSAVDTKGNVETFEIITKYIPVPVEEPGLDEFVDPGATI
jgi:adenylylsulfate reductase subunit B